jgi:hypothetical protein
MASIAEFDKDRHGLKNHFEVFVRENEIQPEHSRVSLKVTSRENGKSVEFDVEPKDIHIWRNGPINPGWGYQSILVSKEVMKFFDTPSEEIYIIHPSAEKAKQELDIAIQKLKNQRMEKIINEFKKLTDDTVIYIESDTSGHLFINVQSGTNDPIYEAPYFVEAKKTLLECGKDIDHFLGKATNIDQGDYVITFEWKTTYKKFREMIEAAKPLKAEQDKKKAEKEAKLEKELAEAKKYHDSFKQVKVYKLQKPSGGEKGRDGWYDADIKNLKTSEIVRVIARNVFDFGFYVFPATKPPFDKAEWTQGETEAVKWVETFPPFTDEIRM